MSNKDKDKSLRVVTNEKGRVTKISGGMFVVGDNNEPEVDEFGFKKVKRGTRPTPHARVLGAWFPEPPSESANRFSPLSLP